MKIAVLAASGRIGSRIVQEALTRGHEVTAIVRHPEKMTINHSRLTVVQGDALDPDGLAKIIEGHDALVSAYSPGFGPNDDQSLFSVAGHNLIKAMKQTTVPRLLVVGGASSLEVSPGVRLLDTPNLPDFVRPHAEAGAKVLDILRQSDIDWTYFSPAIDIEPGTRTGQYRLGKDQPVFNAEGKSQISMEDYAAAMLDEIEQPQFSRQRFTAGY